MDKEEATDKARHDYEEDMRYLNQEEKGGE